MVDKKFIVRFTQKKETIIILLIFTLILYILHRYNMAGVELKPITESNVLAVITSLFVVAIFMERSVEAILIPVRTPDRQKIEQELEDIRILSVINENEKYDLRSKERELEVYKLGTARRAYWLSFIFGLLISLVGVRTLGGLVDSNALKMLGSEQNTLFMCVDIFLTGGVIAGGSAAIDKIGRGISTYFNLKSATAAK